jgi:lanthanide-dependent methanol dehydrogenase
MLALNESTGQWIWGFQATPHDLWDWDCSWWQAMGNETISGAQTQVIFKTCKNGYLYELNAKTGNLIWAWDPPQSAIPRCPICFILDPLNRTQMTQTFFNPNLQPALMYPSLEAGFEDEQSFDPTLNLIFAAAQFAPMYVSYTGENASVYLSGNTMTYTPVNSGANVADNNATVFAINASSGAIAWKYFIPYQGYRGGLTNSGNVVFLTTSSGNLIMLNAKTGVLVRNYFIGGPLNVLPSIGATTNGTEEVIVPITAGLVSWATGVPGDLVALTLPASVPPSSSGATTATATATSLSTVTTGGATVTTTVASGGSTVTATVSGVTATSTVTSGTSSAALYGVAVVAVIFIIATGYLAMRGRKPSTRS